MGARSLFAAAWLLVAALAPAQAPKKLALVGGMLLDGYEVPPLHHAAIVIEGNRIVAVGPAAQVAIPPDAEVVDTSGRTMLPGLIDLHAHLQILGHGDYDRWDPWVEQNKLLERVSEISAKQLLMAGVTSAADLGGTLMRASRSGDASIRARSPGRACGWRGPGSPGTSATTTRGCRTSIS